MTPLEKELLRDNINNLSSVIGYKFKDLALLQEKANSYLAGKKIRVGNIKGIVRSVTIGVFSVNAWRYEVFFEGRERPVCTTQYLNIEVEE